MKTVFILNGLVVATGVAHQPGAVIGTSVPDAIAKELPEDSPVEIGFTYDAVADTFAPPAPEAPKVGPIAFQMLFTPQEMIAADELKATDKVLASFWKLIDDPRTDVVNLGLESVQNAIEYTLTAVSAAIVAAGGTAIDVPARKAAILSGVLK